MALGPFSCKVRVSWSPALRYSAVCLTTKTVTGDNKRMSHILGGVDRGSARFYHATENGASLKTYELFLEFSF